MFVGLLKDTDEEIQRAMSGRALSTGASALLDLGCGTLLICGWIHQPGSSPNPILLGFIWMLHT